MAGKLSSPSLQQPPALCEAWAPRVRRNTKRDSPGAGLHGSQSQLCPYQLCNHRQGVTFLIISPLVKKKKKNNFYLKIVYMKSGNRHERS